MKTNRRRLRVGRRPRIGWASGLIQSPSYLLPQFDQAIALTLGAGWFAWTGSVALLLPVVISLFLVPLGDLLGGRALILGTAGATAVGVSLIAAGGVFASLGLTGLAIGFCVVGRVLAPLGLRHGALTTGHETFGLDGDEQRREATALRKHLVLGIYVISLPAGVIGEHYDWRWVVIPLALLQLGGLWLLRRTVVDRARGVEPPPSRPTSGAFLREFGAGFADPWLLLAGGGALLTQAAVFGYVAAMPVLLGERGFSPWQVGAVLFAAVIAAFFVERPRSMSSPRFGRLAGVVPVTALLAVAVATLLPSAREAGNDVQGGAAAAAIYGLAFATTSVAIELSKQWGQSIAPLQARAGARLASDYRRRAVVELGGGIGAAAGALLVRWTATTAGELTTVALLLAIAAGAWAVQAAWFAHFPRPWKVRDCGPDAARPTGRTRWCCRGREYIVVTGAYMLGGYWTAIYDAPRRGDQTLHRRWRAGFDPATSTVEAELRRLQPAPGPVRVAIGRAFAICATTALARGLRGHESAKLRELAVSVERRRASLASSARPLSIRLLVRVEDSIVAAANTVLERRAGAFERLEASTDLVSLADANDLIGEARRLEGLLVWSRALSVEAPDWLALEALRDRAEHQRGLVREQLRRRGAPEQRRLV